MREGKRKEKSEGERKKGSWEEKKMAKCETNEEMNPYHVILRC